MRGGPPQDLALWRHPFSFSVGISSRRLCLSFEVPVHSYNIGGGWATMPACELSWDAVQPQQFSCIPPSSPPSSFSLSRHSPPSSKAPSLTPCLPQLSITGAQTCIPVFSISSIKSLLHWPCLMPSVHFIPCQCEVYLKASGWHCDCLLASASPKARFRNTGLTGGWQQNQLRSWVSVPAR